MEPFYFLGQAIEVSMTRFLIAQALGLAVLAFDFWSFQADEQINYFRRTLASSTAWVIMYFFIGAQLPIILVTSVSVIRNVVFTWAFTVDTPRSRMIARRTMYGSLILAVIAAAPAIATTRPETRGLQVFLLLVTLGFVIGQYMPGVWMLRISAVTYAIGIMLINSPLDTFDPMGMIIEANKILAVVVFFVVYFRKQKERKRLAAIRPKALAIGKDLRGTVAAA